MENDDFGKESAAFLTWLSEVGVQMSQKAELHDFRTEGRGRGVVALGDFEEDEIIFSIPRTAVFNITTALPYIKNQASKEAILSMPNWLALTTLMIFESLRADSKWIPYLAILPRQLNSLVFWSDAELAELQASTVTNKIGRSNAEVLFSQHIAPLGLENCDTNLAHKVASVIMAYAFDIPEETEASNGSATAPGEEDDDLISDNGEDEKTILSMIPLADMLNADADRNNAQLICDNADLEVRAIKFIATGEEIFNDYGQLPRSDLLRRYGYVTEQYAAYDVAELLTESILVAFKTPHVFQNLPTLRKEEIEMRVGLAKGEGVYEDSYDLAHPGPDGPSIPDELIALVFLLLLDAKSIKAVSDSQTFLSSRSKLSTTLVGETLATLLQIREREYATSIEDDENLLEETSLPTRKRIAIQVRLGEKNVLRAAIHEAKSFSASNKRMRGQASEEQDAGGNKKRVAEDTADGNKKGRFK